MSEADTAADRRPPVLFVLMQTGRRANGGITSLGQIMKRVTRIRPIVLTNADGERVAEWRRSGLDVRTIPLPFETGTGITRRPLSHAAGYARYFRGIRRILKGEGARVIHANDPLAYQLALGPAARTAGTRLVLNLRGDRHGSYVRQALKGRMLLGRCDHALFLSEEMRDRWVQICPALRSRASITYSVVDFEKFRPGTESPDPFVLVSGAIRELKGQLEFLERAVPTIVRHGGRVVFAGDFSPDTDPYAAACARAAAPFGERVSFLGYRKDVADLVRQSAVVAVTSQHEGLVRAMLEGMACAKPVVSFDVCSAREILERRAPGAGIVVAQGDYDSLANALVGFLREPDARASAGSAGFAAARKLFAADQVVSRYEAVYLSLAESRVDE
jgi:glycosyltransferase involved in cell wall biosynthesis